MPEDIAQERVDRFDMFYQTLTPEERAELESQLLFVCDAMRRRCKNFGVKMGKELVMALVDFWGVYGRKGG